MVSYNVASLFSLEGKTALITGASGFLGRTMCQALLDNGARVVALGRSERLKSETASWAAQYGSDKVQMHQIDMYDLDAYSNLLHQISSQEHIDILVNNAHELGPNTGFNTPEGSLERATLDQWMRNLTGGIYWAALSTQIIGSGMKERGAGNIVNTATMYALVAPSPSLYEGTNILNPPGYGASKAALIAFTRYVASFWGPFGVRANTIAPGPFSNTEDATPNAVAPDDPFLQRLNARTCLGRRGQASEIVGALLFLASDASSFVTGHTLVVDGGWTIV